MTCEGWWEQDYFGRQPMHDLTLAFEGGELHGSGFDIIGPFTFHGTISESGQVVMRKQYIGQHSVEYLGTYDGEGLLWGHWQIGPTRDRWMIKLSRGAERPTQQAEVEELV
jgi:hypothetical protein